MGLNKGFRNKIIFDNCKVSVWKNRNIRVREDGV